MKDLEADETNLEEVLRKVDEGEAVVIREGDDVVAEIHSAHMSEEDVLQKLEEDAESEES